MTSPSEPNPFAAPASGAASVVPEPTSGELAGRGQRFLSALIDGLIMGGVVMVIMFATGAFTAAMSGKPDTTLGLVSSLGGMVAFMLINGVLLHQRGQTVGKILMKIRIRRIDGQPTTGMDTIVKRLLPMWLLSIIPVIGGFISLANALFIFRQDRRCLHDLIAGTEVVAVGR